MTVSQQRGDGGVWGSYVVYVERLEKALRQISKQKVSIRMENPWNVAARRIASEALSRKP